MVPPEPPGLQVREVRAHRVIAVSEEVRVLFEGAGKAHLRHETLVVVKGDAAVHGVPGDEDHLANFQEVWRQHVEGQVSLNDPEIVHLLTFSPLMALPVF